MSRPIASAEAAVGSRRWLGLRITGLLTIKLVLLVALWWHFFSPSHRPAADASAIAGRFIPSFHSAPDGGAVHD